MDNLKTARCGRHKAASSQTSEHESQLMDGLDGFRSPVIVDRRKLEEANCECYETMKKQLQTWDAE